MSWEESPLFNVVLIDAQGAEHGFIGYQFHAAGAKAAADSWNAMAERRYTAVIRPVAPSPEPKPAERTEDYQDIRCRDALPSDECMHPVTTGGQWVKCVEARDQSERNGWRARRPIRPVASPLPETNTESSDSEKVAAIREAVLGYYSALDNREHGGVAEAVAFRKIENVLGMHWTQGERTR